MADDREYLIEAVRSGRMLPAQAEAEVQRLGLEPLSFRPPIDDYDPMRESSWTPIMVVAWIIWRTTDAVREAWADYVRRCRIWRYRKWRSIEDKTIYEGYELDRPDPPSLLTLLHADSHPHQYRSGSMPWTKLVQVDEARDEVLDVLRVGAVKATGIALASGGARREIPALEWIDLIFDIAADDDRFTHKRELELHGYRHVLISRDEVLRQWKPLPPPLPAELPAVVSPEGEGFMSVFHALLWIATSGGKERFAPDDGDRWQGAFDALLPKLASGSVALTGETRGGRVLIPAYRVAACRFVPPFGVISAGHVRGADLYLRSCPYVDEEHWRGGLHDALVVGMQERWTRLMVPKDAILKAWPFASDTPTKTGAPGRPTSMHLVRAEFFRRRDARILADTVKQEAQALQDWLKTAHPLAPIPSHKTIRNHIASEFRAAKHA